MTRGINKLSYKFIFDIDHTRQNLHNDVIIESLTAMVVLQQCIMDDAAFFGLGGLPQHEDALVFE